MQGIRLRRSRASLRGALRRHRSSFCSRPRRLPAPPSAAQADVQRARQRRAGLRDRPGAGRARCRCSTRRARRSPRSSADALGGLLFRNVKPGGGYRVRLAGGGETSDPLTVLSTQSAPPSTDVYNQTIPSSGYGYLTTRDGTKLAIDVHPPQDVANAAPLPAGVHLPAAGDGPDADADRVLGLRLRRPGRPAERDRDPRQPHGLHRRRRQHARHRLLGRRVRLLRAAAEPRRLRRHRDDRPPALGRCTTRSG